MGGCAVKRSLSFEAADQADQSDADAAHASPAGLTQPTGSRPTRLAAARLARAGMAQRKPYSRPAPPPAGAGSEPLRASAAQGLGPGQNPGTATATATPPRTGARARATLKTPPSTRRVATPVTEMLHAHFPQAQANDLCQMIAALDRRAGDRWNFTGSVALNLHAIALEGAIARPSVDADVLVPAETANMLSPDSGPDSAAATSDARFGTTATKVDVISARFGASKIHVTAETVLGVAVLSLADLKRFKQADADSAVAATAHKATADLLIIDRLIALKNKDA